MRCAGCLSRRCVFMASSRERQGRQLPWAADCCEHQNGHGLPASIASAGSMSGLTGCCSVLSKEELGWAGVLLVTPKISGSRLPALPVLFGVRCFTQTENRPCLWQQLEPVGEGDARPFADPPLLYPQSLLFGACHTSRTKTGGAEQGRSREMLCPSTA